MDAHSCPTWWLFLILSPAQQSILSSLHTHKNKMAVPAEETNINLLRDRVKYSFNLYVHK